jgi:hypothetical protein
MHEQHHQHHYRGAKHSRLISSEHSSVVFGAAKARQQTHDQATVLNALLTKKQAMT